MNIIIFGLCIIAVGGILALTIEERLKTQIFAFLTSIGSLFIFFPALSTLITGKTFSFVFTMPFPMGKVHMAMDPLSAFFVLVISIVSIIGAIYSITYLKPYLNKNNPISSHLFFLAMLIISMYLVCLLQNSVAFLVVWEIMSVTSFFLVIFEHEKKEVLRAGINYLLNMHLGLFLLMIGFMWLYSQTGSTDFAVYKKFLSINPGVFNALFLLFFAGFGIKAGFFPFHPWLPQAHPAAPSHISGLMSGIMIKTGIYGILRVLSWIDRPELTIGYAVLIIAVISALYGIIYATTQHDIKKILAYSSIENIGIIGIGIGIGMLGLGYDNKLAAFMGFAGALFHVLNHAVFKQLLFYGAGLVYQKTHTRDINKLGGLAKRMPLLSITFLIASMAVCALPPLNGFVSEFIIYNSMFQGLGIKNPYMFTATTITIGLLAFVGAVSLICFTRLFGLAFLGQARSEYPADTADPGLLPLLPLTISAGLALAIGLFPQYVILLILAPVRLLVMDSDIMPDIVSFIFNLQSVSFSVLLFLVLLGAIFWGRNKLLAGKITYYKTWDCGYQAGTSRMQYSASSFGHKFLSLVRPFTSVEVKQVAPEGLFPHEAHYKAEFFDVIERYIVLPVSRTIKYLLNLLRWIQSGDMRMYILYGLASLIIMIMSVIALG